MDEMNTGNETSNFSICGVSNQQMVKMLVLILQLWWFRTVQAAKPSQFFECVVQEFPTSTANKDFDGTLCNGWNTSPLVTGAVLDTLDANNLPQYNVANDKFNGKASFDEWFTASSATPAVDYQIPLDKVGTNWQYDKSSFYPASGQGVGQANIKHFSMRCSSEFIYNGGETFTWRGNDDFWLFVDGKLMIDAGGIHAAGENSITPVSLDTMTHLKKGCSVDVRIFFAERCEKSGSKFRVITDMEPIRPNEGGAFRCLGNGSIGGDSGILIRGNGTDDASIERRNAERLLQIGIILGSVFGFFALWFLILGLVWLCRRDHIREQRLMHRMGGKGAAVGQIEMSKKKKQGGKGKGNHNRQETYAGWSKNTDPNTGRVYYQNQMTGESRWADDLATDNASTINPAQTGWVEHVDKSTGVPFYHNAQTGETSWENPLR